MATRAKHMAVAAPLDPGRVVQNLRSLGLTERDVATATSAAPRTVRRWAGGQVRPQERHAERIDDLREITELLETMLNADGIKQWLRRRNAYLNSERPIDRIRQGDFDAVHNAAVSYLQGSYPGP